MSFQRNKYAGVRAPARDYMRTMAQLQNSSAGFIPYGSSAEDSSATALADSAQRSGAFTSMLGQAGSQFSNLAASGAAGSLSFAGQAAGQAQARDYNDELYRITEEGYQAQLSAVEDANRGGLLRGLAGAALGIASIGNKSFAPWASVISNVI